MIIKPRPSRHGFTLVELLVVMAIIGVLVALILPAVWRSVVKARANRIAQELSQLHMAVESYKQQYTDYPADFSDAGRARAHLRKIFSNHQEGANIANTNMTLPNGQPAETGGTRWDTNDLDPSEALVFWLGMVKNDPRQPLNGNGQPKPFFPFKEDQFVDPDGDGWLSYAPADGNGTPYVYFRGIAYVDSTATPPTRRNTYDAATYTLSSVVMVKPYKSRVATTGPIEWANRDTFQIISGGLDGDFGAGTANMWKLFPRGVADPADTTTEAYVDGDWDNITNFSDGKILRDWTE